MTESGFCRRAGRPPAQHRRLSSASHARRVGTRERSSRYHGYLLRSPIRKNRPLRLSLLRISAGISPLFFRPRFFDNSPLPARYQNKYDNSPAKLDSLQVLVEGHRFFRFPFRFTAGRDAPLFSVLAFFSGGAPLSYNMQKNFVFEQKSPPNFFSGLQWTMLIIMLYFITVSRRLNVLAREYPALTFVPHVS